MGDAGGPYMPSALYCQLPTPYIPWPGGCMFGIIMLPPCIMPNWCCHSVCVDTRRLGLEGVEDTPETPLVRGERSGAHTAIKKLRIVRLGFGTS
jgi:hypothetical protein